MDNYYKQFDFKCVGPKEEREIKRYFESAHWKKTVRLIESGLYTHVHANLEINFDPWILKTLAIDELTSTPFPAATMPLPRCRNKNREKVIRVSRERYTKPVKK